MQGPLSGLQVPASCLSAQVSFCFEEPPARTSAWSAGSEGSWEGGVCPPEPPQVTLPCILLHGSQLLPCPDAPQPTASGGCPEIPQPTILLLKHSPHRSTRFGGHVMFCWGRREGGVWGPQQSEGSVGQGGGVQGSGPQEQALRRARGFSVLRNPCRESCVHVMSLDRGPGTGGEGEPPRAGPTCPVRSVSLKHSVITPEAPHRPVVRATLCWSPELDPCSSRSSICPACLGHLPVSTWTLASAPSLETTGALPPLL